MHTIHGRLASLAGLALVIGCRVGTLLDAPHNKVIADTPSRVATQLAFTSDPPAILVANETFSVEVTAYDAQGATATTFSGPISLTLQGPVVAGGLRGTRTVNAVNGVATFGDLRVTGLCTGCTLTAAASGLATATSSSFDVVAGP